MLLAYHTSAAAVPGRMSDTHLEALLHPGCQLVPLGSLQSFFVQAPAGLACPASGPLLCASGTRALELAQFAHAQFCALLLPRTERRLRNAGLSAHIRYKRATVS